MYSGSYNLHLYDLKYVTLQCFPIDHGHIRFDHIGYAINVSD